MCSLLWSKHRGLWHLRYWLQYWQLRTLINGNLCYLTMNCDTGQHSQFLRCFALGLVEILFLPMSCHVACDRISLQSQNANSLHIHRSPKISINTDINRRSTSTYLLLVSRKTWENGVWRKRRVSNHHQEENEPFTIKYTHTVYQPQVWIVVLFMIYLIQIQILLYACLCNAVKYLTFSQWFWWVGLGWGT